MKLSVSKIIGIYIWIITDPNTRLEMSIQQPHIRLTADVIYGSQLNLAP